MPTYSKSDTTHWQFFCQCVHVILNRIVYYVLQKHKLLQALEISAIHIGGVSTMCRYQEDAYRLLHESEFDKYSLPDLSAFSMSHTPNQGEKFRQFLDYVRNPYLFRVGDIGVHVTFAQEPGKTLQNSMVKILSSHF